MQKLAVDLESDATMKSGLAIVERIVTLVALTSALIGCGDAPASEATKVANRVAPIINGLPLIGDRAVVALGEPGMRSRLSFTCTGTLISRHVVVTAGHCLTFKGKSSAPEAVFFGNDLDAGGDVRRVKKWLTVPSYEPQYTADLRIQDDIGVLILDEEAPNDVVSYALARRAPSIGESARFAGFGCREATGRCGAFGEKYGVATAITAVSDHDFDYGVATCTGDSGGPAFVLENGVDVLSGITSSGDFRCAEYGVATRVDAFVPWLERIIAAVDPSASAGANRRMPLADGQQCTLDSDCASQVCEGVCRPLCNPLQEAACTPGLRCELDRLGAYACVTSLTSSGGCSVGDGGGRSDSEPWLWSVLGVWLGRRVCRQKARRERLWRRLSSSSTSSIRRTILACSRNYRTGPETLLHPNRTSTSTLGSAWTRSQVVGQSRIF